MAKRCPNCGYNNTGDESTCPRCGASYADPPDHNTKPPENTEGEPAPPVKGAEQAETSASALADTKAKLTEALAAIEQVAPGEQTSVPPVEPVIEQKPIEPATTLVAGDA